MVDADTGQALIDIFRPIEEAISAEFQSMLANDAMLTLEFALTEVQPADPAEILSAQPGPVQIIRMPFTWQDEQDNLFLLAQESAEAFLNKINETNDAVDSLAVVFENWGLAAANVLGQKLSQAPRFGTPGVETRESGVDELPKEGVWFVYEATIADLSIKVYRITTQAWQEMIEAASLEVTEVDDIPETDTSMGDSDLDIDNVEFGSLDNLPKESETETGSIEMLYDLKLDLVVELGRTRKQLREILELGRGSIIELEKLAGDPLEIYVNDKKLAEGEVVVVDDHFGIRITTLIKPEDRIRSLGN